MSQTIRLDRLLANLGYGSRQGVQALVRRGAVALDGARVVKADMRVPLTPDLALRLAVSGAPLDPLPGAATVMLNKPVGVTCSHRESGPLVYDLLPGRWRDRKPSVSTVGRLDKDTSGLLLLTDDGALLHRVTSPRQHVPKRYLAILARPLEGGEAACFASGEMMLDGEDKPLAPAELESLSPTRARVTIREGRYHQVRRMFAAVGNHVETLQRISLGGLTLGDLEPGKWRQLTEEDTQAIFAR